MAGTILEHTVPLVNPTHHDDEPTDMFREAGLARAVERLITRAASWLPNGEKPR